MNPPQPGEPSYPLWEKERDAIQASFKRRAERVVGVLNSLEGVQCNSADGAMYVFPRIFFPERFMDHAKKKGKAPEVRVLQSAWRIGSPASAATHSLSPREGSVRAA